MATTIIVIKNRSNNCYILLCKISVLHSGTATSKALLPVTSVTFDKLLQSKGFSFRIVSTTIVNLTGEVTTLIHA